MQSFASLTISPRFAQYIQVYTPNNVETEPNSAYSTLAMVCTFLQDSNITFLADLKSSTKNESLSSFTRHHVFQTCRTSVFAWNTKGKNREKLW